MGRGSTLVLSLILLTAPSAGSGAEIRQEAQAIERGDAPTSGLLDVESIDGAPVDFHALLADDPTVRIEVIARLVPPATVDSDRVLEEISLILSDPKYPADDLSWFGRLMAPLTRHGNRLWAMIGDWVLAAIGAIIEFFGTSLSRWIGVPLLLVATSVIGWFLVRRRARELERRAVIDRILELGLDPEELEGLATSANRAGDHAEAIRLRFVAGLLRLDGLGEIEFAPGLSNGAISSRLGSAGFDRLADQFDRVVYGRESAGPADYLICDQGWRELLGVRL